MEQIMPPNEIKPFDSRIELSGATYIAFLRDNTFWHSGLIIGNFKFLSSLEDSKINVYSFGNEHVGYFGIIDTYFDHVVGRALNSQFINEFRKAVAYLEKMYDKKSE